MPHIYDAIRDIDLPNNIILDGEMYRHGWSLQKIGSACSVVGKFATPETYGLQYHIFDMLNLENLDMPFEERYAWLETFIGGAGHPLIPLVETFVSYDEATEDFWYDAWRDGGYEGLMVRDSKAAYGLSSLCGNKENRWTCILKRKGEEDANCLIVDAILGDPGGKYRDTVGSLVCVHPETEQLFKVSGGLSDLDRDRFLDNPPIGQYARILYEELSDTGVPMRAKIDAIFPYNSF